MAYISMFEPKRILCSIDFSELADLALKYASVAAREYNATLHILHAETFDLPCYYFGSEIDYLIQNPAIERINLRNNIDGNGQKMFGIHAKN
jgi:hypothetical protein